MGCARAAPAANACDEKASAKSAAFRDAAALRYREARARAAAWLAQLDVDPVALRAQGRKGKKHFVEMIDAQTALVRFGDATERAAAQQRLTALWRLTLDDRYHDMATNDALSFKQDATSYLRAALLLDEAGFDVSRYRAEIKAIEARLNAHMPTRGLHQRLVFRTYYAHFGLTPLPDVSDEASSVIRRRLAAASYDKRLMYDLTHEVFAPYHYGESLDVDPFDANDKAYLAAMLPVLVRARMEAKDPDLVAELLSCMRMLRFVDDPAFSDGLRFLLDVQRGDGAFGDYAKHRKRLGSLVDQVLVLHTTAVALDALALGLDPTLNRGLRGVCPRPDPGAAPAPAADPSPRAGVVDVDGDEVLSLTDGADAAMDGADAGAAQDAGDS